MPSIQWFKDQIQKISGSQIGESRAFILCPYHKENTPSGSINLDSSKSQRFLGSFKCYGCKKTATWNDIAEKFGLQTLEGGQAVLKEVPEYNLTKIRSNLLDTNTLKDESKDFDFFPVREKWRGFSADFLNEVGIKLAYHDESGRFYLYLPVTIKGKEVGFIRAQMKKPKNKEIPTYMNAKGLWSLNKGLFPFDYSVKVMLEKNVSTVVLVEGPRDALRLLKAGIPAMSILGTHSWSDSKRRLLERAGVTKIVLLFDGDEAGEAATELIYPTLIDRFEVVVIPLWVWAEKQGLDKEDPCSMPTFLVKKVRRHLI